MFKNLMLSAVALVVFVICASNAESCHRVKVRCCEPVCSEPVCCEPVRVRRAKLRKAHCDCVNLTVVPISAPTQLPAPSSN